MEHMKIFSAHEVQEQNAHREKVNSLLGNRNPAFVWVDNMQENFREWSVYPLYVSSGLTGCDCILPLGCYCFILHKGSRVKECADGWNVKGYYTFCMAGKSVTSSEGDVLISDKGILQFQISVRDMAEIGAGIRYVTVGRDAFVQRTIFPNIYSPVFHPQEEICLIASYFPAFVPENQLVLKKELLCATGFQATNMKTISMKLPEGFTFSLAQGTDINGYPDYYYSPAGIAEALSEELLMPGFSGAEYLRVSHTVSFCPDHKSYFEKLPLQAAPSTSYVSFPDGIYYTQPHRLNFFAPAEPGIYNYTRLPGVSVGDAALPVFPYGGSDGDAQSSRRLETLFLSSIRKNLVSEQQHAADVSDVEPDYAVTRSGMKAAYDKNQVIWMQINSTGEGTPGLAFTSMSPKFWFNLLSSSLFLVMVELNGLAQVPYTVTERRLGHAAENGYPDRNKLLGLAGQTFLTEEELKQRVLALGAVWNAVLKNACCNFNLNLAGWEFLLSPDEWEDFGTLFIVKMEDHSPMYDLMKEPVCWSMELPDKQAARAGQIFDRTVKLCGNGELPQLASILYSNEWRGMAAFDAGVDLSSLPKELSFLANGIDPGLFRASYVAFPAVSAAEGEKGSASAMIYYQDNSGLSYEDSREFGFKVRELKMEVRDDKVYSFHAKVELLINQLFGCKASGIDNGSGNSIIFNGSYQKKEAGGYYAFVMEQPQQYAVENCGITQFYVQSAALQAEGKNCQFVLGGTLSLQKGWGTDLLSYEELPFHGFMIAMEAADQGYRFQVSYESFHIQPELAVSREGSFAAGFPARIGEFIHMEGKTGVEYGFTTLKVKGSCNEEQLGRNWDGYLWKISTGNMGGLAAKTDLTLELLTAWSQNKEDMMDIPNLYCGIRIGSAVKNDSWALPLQGVLSLGFDAIELKEDDGFYFRFRNFSLVILGKRFPDTNHDMYLIADSEGNLGWYGAMEG